MENKLKYGVGIRSTARAPERRGGMPSRRVRFRGGRGGRGRGCGPYCAGQHKGGESVVMDYIEDDIMTWLPVGYPFDTRLFDLSSDGEAVSTSSIPSEPVLVTPTHDCVGGSIEDDRIPALPVAAPLDLRVSTTQPHVSPLSDNEVAQISAIPSNPLSDNEVAQISAIPSNPFSDNEVAQIKAIHSEPLVKTLKSKIIGTRRRSAPSTPRKTVSFATTNESPPTAASTPRKTVSFATTNESPPAAASTPRKTVSFATTNESPPTAASTPRKTVSFATNNEFPPPTAASTPRKTVSFASFATSEYGASMSRRRGGRVPWQRGDMRGSRARSRGGRGSRGWSYCPQCPQQPQNHQRVVMNYIEDNPITKLETMFQKTLDPHFGLRCNRVIKRPWVRPLRVGEAASTSSIPSEPVLVTPTHEINRAFLPMAASTPRKTVSFAPGVMDCNEDNPIKGPPVNVLLETMLQIKRPFQIKRPWVSPSRDGEAASTSSIPSEPVLVTPTPKINVPPPPAAASTPRKTVSFAPGVMDCNEDNSIKGPSVSVLLETMFQIKPPWLSPSRDGEAASTSSIPSEPVLVIPTPEITKPRPPAAASTPRKTVSFATGTMDHIENDPVTGPPVSVLLETMFQIKRPRLFERSTNGEAASTSSFPSEPVLVTAAPEINGAPPPAAASTPRKTVSFATTNEFPPAASSTPRKTVSFATSEYGANMSRRRGPRGPRQRGGLRGFRARSRGGRRSRGRDRSSPQFTEQPEDVESAVMDCIEDDAMTGLPAKRPRLFDPSSDGEAASTSSIPSEPALLALPPETNGSPPPAAASPPRRTPSPVAVILEFIEDDTIAGLPVSELVETQLSIQWPQVCDPSSDGEASSIRINGSPPPTSSRTPSPAAVVRGGGARTPKKRGGTTPRRLRTRGGRGSGGRGRRPHRAEQTEGDESVVGYINEDTTISGNLSFGEAMETPLHVKRQRLFDWRPAVKFNGKGSSAPSPVERPDTPETLKGSDQEWAPSPAAITGSCYSSSNTASPASSRTPSPAAGDGARTAKKKEGMTPRRLQTRGERGSGGRGRRPHRAEQSKESKDDKRIKGSRPVAASTPRKAQSTAAGKGARTPKKRGGTTPRRLRKRGGRGSGGRGRPIAEDDGSVVGYINDDATISGNLSFGKAMETPLHPKRRRLFGSRSAVKSEGRGRSAPAPEERPASPEAPAGGRESPASDQERIPSPAAFETTVGGGAKARRSLWETEMSLAAAYGSEDDTDCEDAGDIGGDMPPELASRSERAMFDELHDDFAPEAKDTEELEPSSEDMPHRPSWFFDFEWRPLPRPPVKPTERREVFSEKKCGPIAPFPTPYDAFVAIWTREFMEYIATETNRYAQEVVETLMEEGSLGPQSRIVGWEDTDADELYVYLALVLATGMCVKMNLDEYWSKGDLLDTPNFAQVMPVRRFLLLSRCLHFNKSPSDITTLSPPKAKLHKIQPILDHLNDRFQNLYVLGRNVALDESLTQWKGHLSINQFISHKAAGVGIKTYEVCEAQTGYLWRFKVHAGREETPNKETTAANGVIPLLVLDLLEGLEHKGRTVWMDNYYNSPALARVLKTLGFDCVGTLRTNRQFVPSHISNLTKEMMEIGQVTSTTSGDVDIILWRDHNRVALISTYHGDDVQTVAGKTKPTVVHDYNICMGGVDKKDQMLSTYPLERKRTRVWYKKLFRRLLNVSVLNSYILHKACLKGKKKYNTTHREFRKSLIRDLIAKHKDGETAFEMAGVSKEWNNAGLCKSVNAALFTSEAADHFPAEYGFIPGPKKERLRRTCVVCKKRVSTYCPACDATLCLPCVRTFHT